MDSGWIDKIVSASAWVWAVIAAGTGVVWWGVLDTGDRWPGWMEPTLASVCLVASFAALCRAGAALRERAQDWNGKRLKRRFTALSKEQRAFLKMVYRTDQREFSLQDANVPERWFEELQQWNYVESPKTLLWVSGDETSRFYLTEAAWRMLDRKLRT